LEPYYFLIRFPLQPPNFKETFRIAIEQGRAAEAAIDSANEGIDGMTNTAAALVADWFPRGEMAVEQ
jgi:hypothetical protein